MQVTVTDPFPLFPLSSLTQTPSLEVTSFSKAECELNLHAKRVYSLDLRGYFYFAIKLPPGSLIFRDDSSFAGL